MIPSYASNLDQIVLQLHSHHISPNQSSVQFTKRAKTWSAKAEGTPVHYRSQSMPERLEYLQVIH